MLEFNLPFGEDKEATAPQTAATQNLAELCRTLAQPKGLFRKDTLTIRYRLYDLGTIDETLQGRQSGYLRVAVQGNTVLTAAHHIGKNQYDIRTYTPGPWEQELHESNH